MSVRSRVPAREPLHLFFRNSSTGTLLPFDAIEFAYTQTSGTDSIKLCVHEFCTD